MTHDPAVRLLELLSLLQRRPVWGGPELAERLAVTTRTVRRDVERLRELGYPVDAAPGPDGGYQLGRGGEMPPLLLDDDEAAAVALALRSAANGHVAGIEEAALSALSKLDRVLPPRLRSRVDALREATVQIGPSGSGVEPDVLVGAAQASAAGQRIRITYRDRQDRVTERRVEPYRMVSTGRRWYLVGRDVDRAAQGDDAGGWRTFRADRIEALEQTGHRFRLEDPPDAAALVSSGVSIAPYRFATRIRFTTTAADLRLRVPPTVGVVEAEGPGHAILSTGADSLDALAGHIISLGLEFQVIEPPELRERLAAIGTDLVDAHS